MGRVRGELEDLAFSFLDPKSYKDLTNTLEKKRKVDAAFLEEVRGIVQEKMQEHDIRGTTEVRIKRIYSIDQKLRRQRISLDQVYDLLAIRIITEDIQELLCHARHHPQHVAPLSRGESRTS